MSLAGETQLRPEQPAEEGPCSRPRLSAQMAPTPASADSRASTRQGSTGGVPPDRVQAAQPWPALRVPSALGPSAGTRPRVPDRTATTMRRLATSAPWQASPRH
eukprot:9720117-Alexandrium_andersonii.AAC.1